MLIKKNVFPIFLVSWIIVIILIYNAAYAGETVKVPKGTVAILFINQKAEITAVGTDGKILDKCELCTPELLKKLHVDSCEKAVKIALKDPELKLCKSLMNATMLKRGEIVEVFVNHTNPCYITIFIDGYQVEVPIPCP
ncbi:MAG: hypothetical protein BA863_15855 [Desulfovibrio sp. S3730MH75]|nr:MAG: hypothetical protein BA863_15855 [Desulfovibrio sp. S3730MH75]